MKDKLTPNQQQFLQRVEQCIKELLGVAATSEQNESVTLGTRKIGGKLIRLSLELDFINDESNPLHTHSSSIKPDASAPKDATNHKPRSRKSQNLFK